MLPYRLDLLPPRAVQAVGMTLREGAERHGPESWRGMPVEDQVNHALGHLLLHLADDQSEDHLAHASCRTLFALELQRAAPTA